MTLEGTVVNGVIVVDAGLPLPEGARVRIGGSESAGSARRLRAAPPTDPYVRD